MPKAAFTVGRLPALPSNGRPPAPTVTVEAAPPAVTAAMLTASIPRVFFAEFPVALAICLLSVSAMLLALPVTLPLTASSAAALLSVALTVAPASPICTLAMPAPVPSVEPVASVSALVAPLPSAAACCVLPVTAKVLPAMGEATRFAPTKT